MELQTHQGWIDVCCQGMVTGLGPKTDGEHYGAVVWYIDGKFWACTHPIEMHFCPWCGTKLNEKTLP